MSYQLHSVFSESPPFERTHYNAVCTECGQCWDGVDSVTTLPTQCPGCNVVKTGHRLAQAHLQHLKCAYQPITHDWNEWVKSPYQLPNTIHPKYGEYRRATNLDTPFKKWLGYEQPKTPTDHDMAYDLSASGLSYEQWLNTPPELTMYLRRDWKLSGTPLNFKQWTEQR